MDPDDPLSARLVMASGLMLNLLECFDDLGITLKGEAKQQAEGMLKAFGPAAVFCAILQGSPAARSLDVAAELVDRYARAAVDPSAEVHPEARVGPFVTVGAGAHIGAGAALLSGAYVGAGASVGAASVLHPRATVLDGCVVGDRVLLCTGAVVGSPGFGLDASGRVPHLGRAVIEDDVTVGAHTCIDRGSLDDTLVSRGAHIDNLVQVGHNAYVGPGVVICAQVGLCGGARVEAGAVLAGQSAVNEYTTVGAGARVAGQSAVTRSVAGGADYSGNPAEPNRARLKRIARLKKLADPR